MTWLIHVANATYLASYAVNDVRWLRWLTIMGLLLLIPYYLACALYAAASWNAVFLVLNLLRLLGTGPRPRPMSAATALHRARGLRANDPPGRAILRVSRGTPRCLQGSARR
jgi:hypothetical protein